MDPLSIVSDTSNVTHNNIRVLIEAHALEAMTGSGALRTPRYDNTPL